MDNITHTLTGALAAKLAERHPVPAEEEKRRRRTLFWLTIVCVNLPDIDVLMNLLGDPVFSIRYHRGLTHSIVFAPIFALLPAAIFYYTSKLKNFKVLWLTALAGILLHIFFDLITGFGTQIFSPLVEARYSLDWMFIIDPVFTALLIVTLLLGKILKSQKSVILRTGAIMAVLYIGVEIVSHSIAVGKVEEAVRQEGIIPTKVSVIAQPLSIFKWMGLVQTKDGVLQTFFSVFDEKGPVRFRVYENAKDGFVDNALRQNETEWYLKFARHPWIQSMDRDGHHVVEFRDLQFSVDESLLRSVGWVERKGPFILRYEFSSDGKLLGLSFNERRVTQEANL